MKHPLRAATYRGSSQRRRREISILPLKHRSGTIDSLQKLQLASLPLFAASGRRRFLSSLRTGSWQVSLQSPSSPLRGALISRFSRLGSAARGRRELKVRHKYGAKRVFKLEIRADSSAGGACVRGAGGVGQQSRPWQRAGRRGRARWPCTGRRGKAAERRPGTRNV